MTDTADAMFVENGTAVNDRVFNIADYHQTSLFLRIEQIEDPSIPLRDVSLSHVTAQHASF